ncbi:hypothetical protein V6N11_054778 [Hibiscus sabdariffa]|uniref:Uncharacterized protein n=1 Tax=Hibiscus sabdariffa TaxID=183260 RepID=A0ABR2S5E9_9ROSI
MASEATASPKQSFIGELDVELKVVNRRRKVNSDKRGSQNFEGGLGKSRFDVLSTLPEDTNVTAQLGVTGDPVHHVVITTGPTSLERGKSIAPSVANRSRRATMLMDV